MPIIVRRVGLNPRHFLKAEDDVLQPITLDNNGSAIDKRLVIDIRSFSNLKAGNRSGKILIAHESPGTIESTVVRFVAR